MATSGIWIASSRDELLDGAQDRVVVNPDDGKSGSQFELVTIDGERYFSKTLGYRTDWIMRVTGDRDRADRGRGARLAPPREGHAQLRRALGRHPRRPDAVGRRDARDSCNLPAP